MSGDTSEIEGKGAAANAAQILPLGQDGLLVRFALTAEPWASAAAQALHDLARDTPPEGVVQIVPSLVSVLFRFDPARTGRAAVHQQLKALLEGRDWRQAVPKPAGRIWHVPAAFGGRHGPDLEECARLAGLSPEAAINQITATHLRVLAIGFAPGQPYLGLLPEAFDLPRMSRLNPRVPQGAIALAVRQLVLFSNASPTGWRQIARTAFRPFRPESEPPVPLRTGDEFRLVPVPAEALDALLDAGDPAGGARCEIRP